MTCMMNLLIQVGSEPLQTNCRILCISHTNRPASHPRESKSTFSYLTLRPDAEFTFELKNKRYFIFRILTCFINHDRLFLMPEKYLCSKVKRHNTVLGIVHSTFSTCFASIEFHSHTDMTIPSAWDNAAKASNDWWVYDICNDAVLVSVSLEILGNHENSN